MNWQMVIALCAVLGTTGTVFTLCVKYIVREELKTLNSAFVSKDIYTNDTKVLDEKFEGIETKFVEIDRHFDYIRDVDEKNRAEINRSISDLRRHRT